MKTTCPCCWGSGTAADEQLSPNFRLSEFLRSDTAKASGIPNVPTPKELAHLRALAVELLQPLRDRFGPLRVTSGFRSEELNAATKESSPTSAHRLGMAADIVPLRSSITEVMEYLATGALPFDQAIDEGVCLHLGYLSPDGKQRRQFMVKRNGVYLPWTRSVA